MKEQITFGVDCDTDGCETSIKTTKEDYHKLIGALCPVCKSDTLLTQDDYDMLMIAVDAVENTSTLTDDEILQLLPPEISKFFMDSLLDNPGLSEQMSSIRFQVADGQMTMISDNPDVQGVINGANEIMRRITEQEH